MGNEVFLGISVEGRDTEKGQKDLCLTKEE